ncbi:MAG: DUF296 domain-containing protein [Candidatus Diapherotrites archaeon]|nr:DUF296 domain-containing protein [Candidatus Diapherotrites archaeon]
MEELITLKINEGEDVIKSIHNLMAEKQIELAVPVFAYGKIKNIELITLGKNTTLFSDNSGVGYEVSAISGKIHRDRTGYYTNISVIINKSCATTAHGLLRKAIADESLEIKFRNIKLSKIIEV